MRWLGLLFVVLLLAGVWAFAVQNSARAVTLSFDVGLAAWQLREPAPVPWVIGVSFAAGLLLAAVAGLRARWALARRVRQLEQELALRAPSPREGGAPGGWG